MILLVLLIVFAFIPFVARQEKRRKAEFAERKRRLMEIGSELDGKAEEDYIPAIRRRSLREQATDPSQVSRNDSSPYRPPNH